MYVESLKKNNDDGVHDDGVHDDGWAGDDVYGTTQILKQKTQTTDAEQQP
jgi:hypothetical protein